MVALLPSRNTKGVSGSNPKSNPKHTMGGRESQSRNPNHSRSHTMDSNLTLGPNSNTQGVINHIWQCNNPTLVAPLPHRNHNRRIRVDNTSHNSILEASRPTHLCSNHIYLRPPRIWEDNNNTRSKSRIRQQPPAQRLNMSSPIPRYPLRLVFPHSRRRRRLVSKKRTVIALLRLLAIPRPWGAVWRNLIVKTVGLALPLFT